MQSSPQQQQDTDDQNNNLLQQVPNVQFVEEEEIQVKTELVEEGHFNFEDFISEQDVMSIGGNYVVDQDEDQHALDSIIIHCAKKNLCFELEYIQTVFQSLNIRASTKFDLFRQQLKEEQNPMIIQEAELYSKVRLEEEKKLQVRKADNRGQINIVDSSQVKAKDMKQYLEKIYAILNQMKKEYLKNDSGKERNQIRKALKAMACHLERTRLYLDNYIYPRDLSLNLIDVNIEETKPERKKAMHLTERLYSIVYKDFFTAYEKCRELDSKIKQMEGQDLEQMNKKIGSESRLSVALQNDLEHLTEESSFIETQTIVSENKTTKDVEEVRKNFLRNTLGLKKDGMMKIIKSFSPSLVFNNSEIEELLEREFSLIFSIKNINITNHELYLTLYQENSQPYSLTAQMDTSRLISAGQQSEYIFVSISMRSLLSNNMAIIINVVEKKKSKTQSLTQNLLRTNEEFNTHKVYKGYTILPLSKLFWATQLRHKQVFEVKEAMFYKQSNSFKVSYINHLYYQVEDRYATLIEKRGFKKYRDPHLAKFINLCYTYRMESKLDEASLEKQNATVVNRINFDQRDFRSKDKEQLKIYKSKEKYRFNDIKIDLNNIAFVDSVKKSPVFRIQAALRDNYGVVYDTVYKSMCDQQFEFTQTYESLIYPNQEDIQMHESFFVRIPTKSLDTLKKIYLIFLVQTLVTNKDSRGSKIKQNNYMNELDKLCKLSLILTLVEFKTEIFGILPLYEFTLGSILKNDSYILTMFQMDEGLFREFVKQDHIKHFKKTEDKLRITIKIISNEFTHNRFINDLMALQEKNTNSNQYEKIINQLKNTETDELIIFHDKILDKLFYIMTYTKSPKIQDLVFETIIQIIQLFQNEYKDYKDFLNQYIEKHFAHQKVYIPLLHQIRQTSEIIKQGFQADTDFENEDVILASIKYLNVVLKLMKISYQEEQSCQDSQPHSNEPKYNNRMGDLRDLDKSSNGNEIIKASTMVETSPYYQKSLLKFDLFNKMKKSVIEEQVEDEDSDDEEEEEKYGNIKYMDPINKGYDRTQSNITEIFDQIVDFMDENFLSKILIFLYEEQHYLFHVSKLSMQSKRQKNVLGSGGGGMYRTNTANTELHQQQQHQLLPKTHQTAAGGGTAKTQVGGGGTPQNRKMMSRGSELIEDYVTKQNFLEGLKDLNFINEEQITKHKIIAMGKILANGILDKVPGNSNKIVRAFCENIEMSHIKSPEMSMHVFYFLHQLFVYLKTNDDLAEDNFSKHTSQKLRIYSKTNLDLKDFFTKILPDLLNFMKQFFKESNPQFRLKESKILEETLLPFNEKTALVLLSVANSTSKEKIKEFIFNEPKKLTALMQNLKKLTKKITFKEPYHIFFEKKKIQVIRKVNEFVISIFMDMNPETVGQEYHQVINQCRLILIFLWSRLAKIKADYKKTTRSKTQVKDQLKVQKDKMLEIFRLFWHKYKGVGQPWMGLRYLTKEMQQFIKLGQEKAIRIYMEMISDTIQIEYKSTQDIFHTSSSIFSVFNDLNMQKGKEEFCKKFYQAFEIEVSNTQLYANDSQFQKLVEQRFDQMRKLSEALQNVNYSNSFLQQNIFYRTFCQAKLMEVFWELKLFKLFNENKESFKKLHHKLDNYSEMAFTDLRFLQIIQQSEEDYLQIGQREIKALIQIDLMKSIVENLKKSELYEKAIEIFNQMKDLFENVIYDFDAVSRILKEQSKIYKAMSVNQNRHYACYFKIGFFGQSFPNMLKNQEFILRGGKLVKRLDIIEQIKRHFQDIININDLHYPTSEVLNGMQKYLQITPVFPLTFRELKDFGLDQKTKDKDELAIAQRVKDLPEKLRIYYTENYKNKFYKETVIPSKQGDELQSDIQIEIFKVKDKFPTIINMQSIVKIKKLTLNAVDKATRFVQEHIDHLEQLKKNVVNQVSQEHGDLDLLASHIRATLESPIQGGIQRYINAFVNETYLQSPIERPKVLLLFKKMEECSKVLFDSIQVYQHMSDDDRLQTKMNGDYLKFKEQLGDIRAYIDETAVKGDAN